MSDEPPPGTFKTSVETDIVGLRGTLEGKIIEPSKLASSFTDVTILISCVP